MRFGLGAWDWSFLTWFLVVSTGVGVYYTKRAGKDLAEYFLSGRNLPGWVLGTSMVATTFASDTPLVVTGLVISKGIAGNWLWWSFAIGGTLTVFMFSRLWRRSGVVTEIELIRHRYSGRPALFLRGFKALYLGLLVNSIMFGWVTKAMGQIVEVVFDIPKAVSLGILIGLTLLYTLLSGLWGVVATDVLQFAMAMVGAIILAVLSVQEVGGLDALVTKVTALSAHGHGDLLSLVPTGWNAFTASIFILVLVNWWAVYYPGAEPGGGGFIAQRMLAAKDEYHARSGTLWFTIAHYVIRPWPWIIVALCAVVLEPRFLDPATFGPEFQPEKAYPWMFRVLPKGFLGLMVASFFAAFMSTITSVLNLSASYLINDFYLPYVARGRALDDRTGVKLARVTVALVTLIGCFIAWRLESAGKGWSLIMEVTAGTGLVLIARWIWWRVNAWSEISSMLASTASCLWSYSSTGTEWITRHLPTPELLDSGRLLFIVCVTTTVWLLITFVTKPTDKKTLQSFFELVQPPGFWTGFRAAFRAGFREEVLGNQRLSRTLGASSYVELKLWATSTILVFSTLLSFGSFLLLKFDVGLTCAVISFASALWTYRLMKSETCA